MSIDLNGRKIVVTGGTGALGSAVVEQLLAAGAHCYVPMIESTPPAHFALADHERVSCAAGIDLTDEAAVAAYYDGVGPLWGSIHIAGGFAMAPLVETALADLQRLIAMNGVSCFLSCREAVRQMRAAGAGGRIVNIGARPAIQATGGMVAYTASKAMVVSMTQSLAVELAADGILVNAVLPSTIDTPANRRAMPDADHSRWPTPAQIAATIGFLVSPGNAVTSGALVPVYGRA